MFFDRLPQELLQLITLHLTNEEIQCWSLVCKDMHTLLRKLWNSSFFWKERYCATIVNSYCSIDKLLSETISFYGWRALYFRVCAQRALVHREYYIGVTGNLYILINDSYEHFITLPMRELLWSEKTPSGDIILMYLDYNNYLYIVSGYVKELTFHYLRWNIIRVPIINYRIDNQVMVFLTEDGTAIICHDRTKLRKHIDVLRNQVYPITEYGIDVIYSPGCGYNIQDGVHVFVDTFRVAICEVTAQGSRHIEEWPRTSSGHLANLTQAITKLRI